MIRSTKALAIGASLFLSACTGGTETSSTLAGQIGTIFNSVQESRAPKAETPQLTPEIVASIPVAAIEIVLEDRGATGIVVPYASRNDGRNGTVATWRNARNSQIILRDGVLIATRGTGNDLGSSRVSSVVESINTLRPVSGPHNMFVKGYGNDTTRIDLDCEMESLGQTRIEIVGRAHNVVHLRENCMGPDGPVTNDYWVDRSDSTVWQSRQWAGPDLGYFRMRLLKK